MKKKDLIQSIAEELGINSKQASSILKKLKKDFLSKDKKKSEAETKKFKSTLSKVNLHKVIPKETKQSYGGAVNEKKHDIKNN